MSGKKRKRHSPKQIVQKLGEADRLLNGHALIPQAIVGVLFTDGEKQQAACFITSHRI